MISEKNNPSRTMERSKRITVYGLAIYLLLFVSQLHAAGLAEWYEAAGDSFFEKMNSVKSEKENFAAMKMGMDGAITAPSVPSTPAPAFVSPYNKAQLDDFSNNMPLDEDEVKIYQK